MFGQNFYFDTLRKYTMLFGTLFNDITIKRWSDDTQTVTQDLKIPITFSAKDKMLARVFQDPDISRPTAMMTLPLMSFDVGNMVYNGDRKLTSTGRSVVTANSTNFQYQYNPVPYDVNFKLYIYVKNIEDGTKIVETIVPFFTPDWTTSINLIPEMNITMDIPIILNSVTKEDNYDKTMTESRAIIWTLDFTLKGYFYGPVKTGPVIKFTKTNFYIPEVPDYQLSTAIGNTPIVEQLTSQPGLTANGQPTSNISLTIPYQSINVTDDFGFIDIINNENGNS